MSRFVFFKARAHVIITVDATALVHENKAVHPNLLSYRINKQWEVIALEQLTSKIEQAHNRYLSCLR